MAFLPTDFAIGVLGSGLDSHNGNFSIYNNNLFPIPEIPFSQGHIYDLVYTTVFSAFLLRLYPKQTTKAACLAVPFLWVSGYETLQGLCQSPGFDVADYGMYALGIMGTYLIDAGLSYFQKKKEDRRYRY